MRDHCLTTWGGADEQHLGNLVASGPASSTQPLRTIFLKPIGRPNVGGIRMFTVETTDLCCGPIIPLAAEYAREADETRTVNPAVLTAVRQSELLALSASPRIGGRGAAIGAIGRELEALAGACASTAWCVWNHLCVFHLFCGVLGPDHAELLAAIVDRHEWVCFPAGAGSGILAERGGRLRPPDRSGRVRVRRPLRRLGGGGLRHGRSRWRRPAAARPALHRRSPRRTRRFR